MRFWQSLVTAQMCAGFVWAYRYHDVFWAHMLADAGHIAIAYLMWRSFAYVYPTPHDGGQ